MVSEVRRAEPMDDWRRQDAARQAHRRDLNESIEGRVSGRRPEPRVNAFVCECGDPRCTRRVDLSSPEYETVRAYPNHFLIAANHENPEVESVVTETKRFAVVQTLVGEASKIALRTDPRALHHGATRASS